MADKNFLAVRGLELMTLIAICDGSFDPREKKALKDYVHSNLGINFNDAEIINHIKAMTDEEQLQLLIKNANIFKENSGLENRKKMLKILEKLVAIDRKITEEEQVRIDILWNYWDEASANSAAKES